MDEKVFGVFSRLIEEAAGIHLTEQKRSLLSNRIQKRLRALHLQSEAAYLQKVQADGSGEELINLIDAVSTNVTYFYREPKHFDILGGILRTYRQEGRKRIRIWDAASSSGEEPFTIAITAAESLDLAGTDLKILATDICTRVLHEALEGVYQEKQLEKTPPAIRKKYFLSANGGGDGSFQIANSIRSMVMFKKLNLAVFPYPLKGNIDVIFCRNVMIYFDRPLRSKVIAEFERLLAPVSEPAPS